MAAATIPKHLIFLLNNNTLLPPYYLHHYPPPPLMQGGGGYWVKGGLDPEPGRCRRTDGKKWRCSRDVVSAHKYCGRHVHRGRNRSRNPVEFPISAAAGAESLSKPPSATLNGRPSCFLLPGPGVSSFDAFQLQTGSEELKSGQKTLLGEQNEESSTTGTGDGDGKSNNKVLMHLFDDWPKSDNPTRTNRGDFLTSLSMSTLTTTPANSTSDFLKLSTGNGDEQTADHDRGQISWTGAWAGNPVVSMGGPLAEALGSSTNSSPTTYQCSTPVA